jgi:hypothetical protein
MTDAPERLPRAIPDALRRVTSAALIALAILSATAATAIAATVRVDGATILVDGRPFFIRGAAGTSRLALLRQLGANTVRTYGDDPGPVLDEAAKVGLKVIAGLWLEPPRRGFNYGDPAAVNAQLDRLREMVRRYKDHPALLMWGIGNEVEAELGNAAPVWPAIEQAARMVKSVDPNHPTMAVLQEAGDDKARKIHEIAPSVDVLGVNSYGDALFGLPARVRQQRWTGPLVITEFGPRGAWQVAHTPWNAPVEPTSTAKATMMQRYLVATAAPGIAGQIVFYWGQKQEVTPTWYGLFLPDGGWTQALEAMAQAWHGRTPAGNRAPRIAALHFADGGAADGAKIRRIALQASDPDGDALAVRWQLLAESTDRRKAGDLESVPPDYSRFIRAADARGARLEALPPGNYRIFVYLRDPKGAAATGNLPFQVR